MREIIRQSKLPLSRSTIYRRRRDDPDFPTPIDLGGGQVGFFADELEAYFSKRRKPLSARAAGEEDACMEDTV